MPTPEQTKELLPVIIAFAEGKQIQFRHKRGNGEWENHTFGERLGFHDDHDYRIKPEKKVFEQWINVYPNNVVNHKSKGDADGSACSTRLVCLHIKQEYYEEGEGL